MSPKLLPSNPPLRVPSKRGARSDCLTILHLAVSGSAGKLYSGLNYWYRVLKNLKETLSPELTLYFSKQTFYYFSRFLSSRKNIADLSLSLSQNYGADVAFACAVAIINRKVPAKRSTFVSINQSFYLIVM